MSHGGKGSKARPFSVPLKTFDNNWDTIFGKKDKGSQEKPTDKPKDNKYSTK
jgi:hypothetical protein